MRLFRPWGEIDWGNQAAHAGVGFAATAAISFLLFFATTPHILIPCIATSLVMTFALWRELIKQHPDQCGEGCRTDLLGWFVGIVLANIVMLPILM